MCRTMEAMLSVGRAAVLFKTCADSFPREAGLQAAAARQPHGGPPEEHDGRRIPVAPERVERHELQERASRLGDVGRGKATRSQARALIPGEDDEAYLTPLADAAGEAKRFGLPRAVAANARVGLVAMLM